MSRIYLKDNRSMYVRSVTRLYPTIWNPLSMGFSGKESWSGLPFPPLGDLPDPGIELASPALAGGFFITEPPGKKHVRKLQKKKALRDFLSPVIKTVPPLQGGMGSSPAQRTKIPHATWCGQKIKETLEGATAGLMPCIFPPHIPHTIERIIANIS